MNGDGAGNPRGQRGRTVGLAVALLVATVVAYWPAIHGGFIWDDDDYVTDSPALRDADGLKRIWLRPGTTRQYYPLVHTTFWIEARVWGYEPLGYHAVNVLLHGASALLLWLLLRRLGVRGAWFAAAVFALHPVHVESVAWITERKNTLSTLLYLAAASSYLRFSMPRTGSRSDGGRWRAYAISLLLFSVIGLVGGSMMPLYGALIGRLFGADSFGQVIGLGALVGLPMLFLGPLGFGYAFDATQSYSVGLVGLFWALA